MNERLQKFDKLETHAWLGRIWSRLSPAELEIARRFCIDNQALDEVAFERKVTRLWLDTLPLAKPKHDNEIRELLLCANTPDREKMQRILGREGK